MDPVELYEVLYRRFGPQRWWPGDSPFEIMAGAILTQQTTWANAESAIANLKDAGALSPGEIATMDPETLEGLIRPAGFYRQKAGYLRDFCRYLLKVCGGDTGALFQRPGEELRREFLGRRGIGPETADSMLLYAGNKATFVVDAYTVRICRRVGLLDTEKYAEVKGFFEANLPRDAGMLNEYHALFVKLGKDVCRPNNPKCLECPLKEQCRYFKRGTEELQGSRR